MAHEFMGPWRYTFLPADGSPLATAQRGVINIMALGDDGSGLQGTDTPSDGRQPGAVTGSASPAGATFGNFLHIVKGANEFFDGTVIFTNAAQPPRMIVAGRHRTPVRGSRPLVDDQAQSIWVATKP